VRTTPSLTHEDLCRIGDMTRRGEVAMAVSEHPSFSPTLLRELLVDFDGYVDALVRQPAVLFRSDMRQIVCELAAPDSAALTRIIEMAMSSREVRTAFRRQVTGAPEQVTETISRHGDVLLASLLREDLLPLLESDDETVRAWAITALGVVGRRGCLQEETRANRPTFLGLRRTRRVGFVRIDPLGVSLAGWRFVPERIVRALALDDNTRYGEYPRIPLGSRWTLFAPAKSERGKQLADWLAHRRLVRSLE